MFRDRKRHLCLRKRHLCLRKSSCASEGGTYYYYGGFILVINQKHGYNSLVPQKEVFPPQRGAPLMTKITNQFVHFSKKISLIIEFSFV